MFGTAVIACRLYTYTDVEHFNLLCSFTTYKKVPVHAVKAYIGSGGIAPLILTSALDIEVSGQLHVHAVLLPKTELFKPI